MESNQQVSAVSRCPSEIWLLIFDFISPLSAGQPWISSFQPMLDRAVIVDERLYTPKDIPYFQRSKSIAALLNIVRVCRAWKEGAYPLLLEWIIVHDEKRLDSMIALFNQPFRGRCKGMCVRRLEIPIFPKDINGLIGSTSGLVPTLVRLVEGCSQLEDFSWRALSSHLPGILPTIIKNCKKTLRCLEVSNGGLMQDAALRLALEFPRLESLDMEALDSLPLEGPPYYWHTSIASNLRWLSLSSPDSGMLVSVAELQLPDLRHLRILHSSRLPEVLSGEPADAREYYHGAVTSVVQSHGHKLQTLYIQPSILGDMDHGLGFAMLEHCPQIQNFFFDFELSEPGSVVSPLSALRQISCRGFCLPFAQSPDSPRLQAHIQKVLRAVFTFCSKEFPNLEVIRCLDLAPRSRYMQQFGRSTYTELLERVTTMCESRNVRFEDCAGGLLRSDCVSVYAWSSKMQE